MSFVNAGQALQRFIINQDYLEPPFENITAVVEASRNNTSVIRLAPSSTIDATLRETKISYYPIVCDVVADTCTGDVCVAGNVQQPVHETFIIKRCIRSQVQTLNISDVRYIDQETAGGVIYGFSDHAKAQIAATFGALRAEFARQIDALLLANAGLMLDGSSTKRVTIADTQTAQLVPTGLWEIERDFRNGGFSNPYILGGQQVDVWRRSVAIGADNNNLGINAARLGTARMYYDHILDDIAGDTANGDHILAFDARALKFVTFNKNMGIYATEKRTVEQIDAAFKEGPDWLRGVILDTRNGIWWDLVLNFEKCQGPDADGAFNWFLRLYWDIWFPKLQHCNPQGVNGIFHYRTCPRVQFPCPSGTPYPSPAPAQEFSWTPGDIYPLFVSSATIGSVSSLPNVSVTDLDDLVNMMNDAYGAPGFFQIDGSNVVYTGFKAISGLLNPGPAQIAITFA